MYKIYSPDLICFSHLRWDFVYQRPQHLMTRFSKYFRVFFIEEPYLDNESNSLQISKADNYNIWIITPHLLKEIAAEEIIRQQVILLNDLFSKQKIEDYTFWYYTPMPVAIGNHFTPRFIIYDCMDELSSFKFAPPELKQREEQLFNKADIVFTGGYNLYKAKKNSHHNIHPFPSSIDKEHFSKARLIKNDPEDQVNVPYPRFGFYGVVDERFNIELLKQVAEKKTDWHFVIIGPVVKIDPQSLPRLQNIHYLGGKSYKELPSYLAGWDIAIIPFVLNESTKHISPTKTPEYLSGGKPVISTSIIDVVTPYGDNGLVHIADTAEEFINCAEIELNTTSKIKWLSYVDEFLQENSWDSTWQKMMDLITDTMNKKERKNIISNLNKKVHV